MMGRLLLTSALATLCVMAGGQAAPAANPNHAQEVSNRMAALREEWARNLHEKNVDASVAEYTADAEFINPDGGRVAGTAALRDLFEKVTSIYDSDLHFDSVRVEASGDLAYDSGTYSEKLLVRTGHTTQEASGSYLTVYRRSQDGRWLIAEQIWTGTVRDAGEAKSTATQ